MSRNILHVCGGQVKSSNACEPNRAEADMPVATQCRLDYSPPMIPCMSIFHVHIHVYM
ncbi:hypothetical protein HDV62DRAFT_351998 [Trichoderma sp. SZMC 28011]